MWIVLHLIYIINNDWYFNCLYILKRQIKALAPLRHEGIVYIILFLLNIQIKLN